MRAPFVVFEGVDGSGKSTAARYFTDALISKGISVILTEEPTRFEIGKIIRKYLAGEEHNPKQLLFLFMADRCYHNSKILDSLNSGCVVVCDRYSLSSRVYQDGVVDDDLLDKLCSSHQFNIKTELMIYTIANAKILIDRISQKLNKDIFETEAIINTNAKKYSQFVKNNYNYNYALNIESVDTGSDIEDTQNQLNEIIESYWFMFSEYVRK